MARHDSLPRPRREFLGVYFEDCRAYGRMHKTPDGTAYEGRCPRCGTWVRATIGPEGSSERFYRAFCRG